MKLLAAVAALSLGLAITPSRPPEEPGACAVGGLNFASWWHDEYASPAAERSLEELAGTGSHAVALIATQYQDGPESSDVAPDPLRTPSDGALRRAVVRAHALGLRVRLRIMVDLRSGQSRTVIDPSDRDAWFAAYRRLVRHYARLAQATGVETLEIGAELKRLTGPSDAERWRGVIRTARRHFDGRLAYAANWDEYGHISWWGQLDEIAIDAYFPLAAGPDPSEGSVIAAWEEFADDLAALAARWERRIVFAELGYPSSRGALAEPWRPGGSYSGEEQAIGLDAACRALGGRPWFGGAYVWEWSADPAAGGPGDTGYTIQGKPAEDVVRHWFSQEGGR